MTEQEKVAKYKENWYALAIAVITKTSVSEALRYMNISCREVGNDRNNDRNAVSEM